MLKRDTVGWVRKECVTYYKIFLKIKEDCDVDTMKTRKNIGTKKGHEKL